MAIAYRPLLLCLSAAVAAGLHSALAPTAARSAAAAAASSLLPRSRLLSMQDSGAKITIKKPGDSSSSGDSGSGAKVSVRVRPKGERSAAAAAPADAAAAEDMSMTVSVKKGNVTESEMFAAAPPPPPSLATEDLTEAEERLLEGTTKANCTILLEALRAGANPNVRDPKGRTPLHFVAGLGLAPAAVILIHFGAQINVEDGDGLKPVHMAAGYANAQTLRVLVQAGADVNVTASNQGTPLQVVLQLGEYQLTQFMNRSAWEQRTKKKDDKLEKLKGARARAPHTARRTPYTHTPHTHNAPPPLTAMPRRPSLSRGAACLDIFDDIEAVREESDWDDMFKEVLQLIADPDANDAKALSAA